MRTPLYLEHCPLIISSSEEHWATWDEICNMFYHWPVQNFIFFIISNIGWDNIFLSSASSEYNIFWVQNLIFLIIIVWATWNRHWHFHRHYHLLSSSSLSHYHESWFTVITIPKLYRTQYFCWHSTLGKLHQNNDQKYHLKTIYIGKNFP